MTFGYDPGRTRAQRQSWGHRRILEPIGRANCGERAPSVEVPIILY